MSAAASTPGFPSSSSIDLKTGEIHHLKQLDAILVCSKWAAGVVASSGIHVPTTVAPLGVDRSIFHESIGEGQTRDRDRPREPGPTIFVNNGKWEWRKGHDFLLQAFCNAFTPSDNFVLKLLCRNYVLSDEANDSWANIFLGSRIGSKVQLVPRLPTQPRLRLCSPGATAASSRLAPRDGTSGCWNACRSA